MFDDIYNTRILEFAGNNQRIGRLENPDASARAHSKLCGSTVIVDLNIAEGRITDFAHEVKACALGQAASSIMARHAVGADFDTMKSLRLQAYAMLKEGGPPPEGEFADFAILQPVREYKARHASTLLTFDAVVAAIEKWEAASKEKASKPLDAECEIETGQVFLNSA